MLTVNQQTELEILQSIENPTPPQKIRIEYLLSKKDSKDKIQSFEPVDIDSMKCKCLNCFLRTIPEHSEHELLVTELNRYFKYKSKNRSSYENPVVASMHSTVLNEVNILQVFSDSNKSLKDLVTIDTVIHKYKENKLSKTEIQTITQDPNFIESVYEVCLFILQTQIELAEKYNLKSLLAVQTFYMTVDLMFSVLDKYDHEPSWDLVNIVHANFSKELECIPKLARLLSDEYLHSNCTPDSEDILSTLKEFLENEL